MMKNNPFSESVGKKVPYKVPVGFFDAVTEKTFQKAKKRKQKARVRKLTVLFSAAASVLIIVIFAGFHFIGFEKEQIAQPFATVEMKSVERRSLSLIPDSLSDVLPKPVDRRQNAVSKDATEFHEETFENLLASLTEEELQFLAGQISAELYVSDFIEE